MKINSKHLVLFIFSLILLAFFAVTIGFTPGLQQKGKGSVEGYIFPKSAKARIEVPVPHPQKPDDTIHKVITPNAAGYFKLNNIPAGERVLIYYPKDQEKYKSTSRLVTVIADKTISAGTITLEAQ